MDDLADKIGDFLKDPNALEQIMGLGSMLGIGSDENKSESDEKGSNQTDNPGFPDDIMGTILKLMPILMSMNQEDENTRLLNALRPFLKEEKRKKIDEAIKMMQMFKLLPLLKSQGIF